MVWRVVEVALIVAFGEGACGTTPVGDSGEFGVLTRFLNLSFSKRQSFVVLVMTRHALTWKYPSVQRNTKH